MKTKRFNTSTKGILFGVLTSIIALSFLSCSQKVNFLTSSVVPAARGYVKVTKDRNNNYVIQIQLYDLAEVKRLQPSRFTYVVWMVTDQELTRNIGQLNSSTGLFSKKLKASFKTVSSYKPTKIFITAEDNANTQFPGEPLVLSTNRF
ncbi:MAG: hypothetical protein NTU44_04540 [Bacteroidetes bacterium]|nr:hypothetical protein [Bacteroidota bacterium]